MKDEAKSKSENVKEEKKVPIPVVNDKVKFEEEEKIL